MSRLATATSLLGITTDGVSKDLLDETTVLVETVKQAQASGKLSHKNFLGSSNEEYAEVTGWLSTSSNALDATALSKLNSIFATKTYLVNQYFSLADVVVFIALHAQNHIGSLNSLPNLSRWFNHIQHLLASFNVLPAVSIPVAPFSILLPALETASAAPVAAPVAVPVATPIAVATPAATEAKKEEPKKEETKKEDKKVKVSSTPAPAAAATAPAAAGGDDSDPSKLEIRVGLIVKCWDHPDSDKLLCEEIDVGEGSTRTIASGIRAYYTAEEVQGRKVLVVSNLKERAMAGFKSQGMVLCASKKEEGIVKFVEVPSNANVGDRVVFTGFSGEPATASQVAKKKILEGLLPHFHSDSTGVVHWKDSAWTIGGEKVTASVSDAAVA